MKLKGVLDFSLGNFLCLRGFAPMGALYDLSEPDPSIQRDLLKEHRAEMVAFLSQGEFLFFPEVILCTTLSENGQGTEAVDKLLSNVRTGQRFSKIKFEDFNLSCTVNRITGDGEKDTRSITFFNTATLFLKREISRKFSRIDGNHRLSATPEDEKFRKHNTPFCLIFFRNKTDSARFSRALFHNINYKQIPLTMEQNLRLILDDADLFPNEKLKTIASFGWAYYLARHLYNRLDLDLLPNLRHFIEKEPRTFFMRQFSFLIEKKVLGENENAIKRVKEALGRVNALLDANPTLKDSRNQGLLAGLVYYELNPHPPTTSFIRWVLQNHLHYIPHSNESDFMQIFDKVLESRKRTVFVSMPIGKEPTENHYHIIERVCKEVSETHLLKPALKVERVDWFQDGTSYNINDKIVEMICDCGLLIGNLTFCNPNVYHEIGFIMGKAKAENSDSTNILLFLDESVADRRDKFVGFNLSGIKQLRFKQSEKFASDLKENLERYFKLKQ